MYRSTCSFSQTCHGTPFSKMNTFLFPSVLTLLHPEHLREMISSSRISTTLRKGCSESWASRKIFHFRSYYSLVTWSVFQSPIVKTNTKRPVKLDQYFYWSSHQRLRYLKKSNRLCSSWIWTPNLAISLDVCMIDRIPAGLQGLSCYEQLRNLTLTAPTGIWNPRSCRGFHLSLHLPAHEPRWHEM